jgi:hypothetical protein
MARRLLLFTKQTYPTMDTIKIISGSTAEDISRQLAQDVQGEELIGYHAVLRQDGLPDVLLDIEVDLGGGFEGGYEWTRFSAPVQVGDGFRFALHHESFLDKAGKLLGLEDKVIGYPDFDKEFIIKTNNEAKVKTVFEEASVRGYFQSLEAFNLHIAHADGADRLELEIEQAITDATTLHAVYRAFANVLIKLQA